MKYFFSLFKNGKVEFSKFWRISAYRFFERNCCFVELYQFLTNWSFLLKKRKNLSKNGSERRGTQSPCQLISVVNVFASVNKVDLSSESLKKPLKCWSFGVVALKKNFIEKVVSVFGSISIYTQAALGVYKTSQISKVFHRWSHGVSNGFKFFFEFWKYKIVLVFLLMQQVDIRLPSNFVICCTKGSIKNAFFFLFNKIWNNFSYESRLSSCRAKMKTWFVAFIGSFNKYIPTKSILEPIHRLFNGRNNQERGYELVTRLDGLLSKAEASISVNISSGVSKIGYPKHTAYCSLLGYLSQQVIEFGQPN